MIYIAIPAYDITKEALLRKSRIMQFLKVFIL